MKASNPHRARDRSLWPTSLTCRSGQSRRYSTVPAVRSRNGNRAEKPLATQHDRAGGGQL